LIEDEPFQQAIADALESAGWPVLAVADRLSEKLNKGYRIVQLTDRQSWRRRIPEGDGAPGSAKGNRVTAPFDLDARRREHQVTSQYEP
jgi:hypothetical protein